MKLTSFFNFKKPEGSDPVNVEDFNDNFDKIDEELHGLQEANGDMSNGKVFASMASTRTALASGDTNGTILGKLMKWLADLKKAAFCDVANNDNTTAEGYVADARQVKAHGDEIDAVKKQIGNIYFGTNASGKWGYKTAENGEVTPFRNPTGNAAEADVLVGKTFSSANLENAAGTMQNNGAWNCAPSGSTRVTVPKGYHNGSGYVDTSKAYNSGRTQGRSDVTASTSVSGRTVTATLSNGKKYSANVGYAGSSGQVTCNTSGGTGNQTFNIADGWTTSIIVNRTGAYNAGYSAGYSNGKNDFSTSNCDILGNNVTTSRAYKVVVVVSSGLSENNPAIGTVSLPGGTVVTKNYQTGHAFMQATVAYRINVPAGTTISYDARYTGLGCIMGFY